MKTLRKSLIAFCIGATAMGSLSAIAGDAKTVFVNINKHNDNNAVVDLKIDGEADAFSMPELQVGESETFTTSSGKTVIATKTEEGYVIDVEGKEIKIPMFSGKLGARLHRSMPLHHTEENVINISGIDLDENQKQIIRDGFAAAGIDKEIKFNKNKFMVFSTGDVEIDGEHKVIEWHSKDGEDFDVIVDSDIDSNVKLHKKIEVKVKKDFNDEN